MTPCTAPLLYVAAQGCTLGVGVYMLAFRPPGNAPWWAWLALTVVSAAIIAAIAFAGAGVVAWWVAVLLQGFVLAALAQHYWRVSRDVDL